MPAKKRRLNKKIVTPIVLALVALIIIIAAVISYFSRRIPKNPKGTVGNTSGNLNNKGLFVEDKDEIYFINPYDNNYIYKMNLDGTRAQLFMDVEASYLNSAGKFIYFNQQSSGNSSVFGLAGNMHGIYRKKKTGNQDIKGLERAVAGVTVLIDNTVYYQHGDSEAGTTLHKTDTDGRNKELVSSAFINPSCVINGEIYYPDYDNNHYLSVLNKDLGTPRLFLNERVHNPTYYGNHIYYMSVDDNYALYRYDLYSNTIELITDDRVDTFNIANDLIYYQKSSKTEPALIRMGINGDNAEVIAEGNYTNINTTSYYTYFQDFLEPDKLYRTANARGSLVEQFIP